MLKRNIRERAIAVKQKTFSLSMNNERVKIFRIPFWPVSNIDLTALGKNKNPAGISGVSKKHQLLKDLPIN